MSALISIIVALVIIFIIFKVATGIIKTFGIIIVIAAVLAYMYFSGGGL